MKTTFEKIKNLQPSPASWQKLINYHKPESLDQEIELKDVIKSNGIKEALWALRTIEDKKSVVLFCTDVAESVLHIFEKQYPGEKRVRECIEACRQYTDGKITKEELEVKRKAAYAVAVNTAEAADFAADAAKDADDAVAYAGNAAKAADYATYADAYYTTASCTIASQQKWNEITNIFLKYF